MKHRVSGERRPSDKVLDKMLKEMNDLVRDLGLTENQTVFIKRSAESRSGQPGKIDRGWSMLHPDPRHPKDRVIVAKMEGKTDDKTMHNRPVDNRELVRLNTGRNRGALEYVFKGADTPERADLIEAVDSADDSSEAREKLTEFFRKEALAKARKMLKGTPVKLKARTFEEMTEEISEHLHEAEDFKMEGFREILAQSEANEKATKELAAKKEADEQDVKDAEADAAAARKNKRHFETQWKTDVQELLSLIDLAGQFTR